MEKEFEIYNFFKTPKVLKEEAKEGLIGNKGKSVAVNIIFMLSKLIFALSIVFLILAVQPNNINTNKFIIFIILAVIFLLTSILTFGPLYISKCKHSINMVENTNPQFKDVTYGFKNKYFRNVFYGITRFFLSFFLVFIPLFFVYIKYQLAGYILAENNETKIGQALKLSSLYSKGHLGDYLKLFFSFILKFILSLTIVYILFLLPNMNATYYCYYRDLKE